MDLLLNFLSKVSPNIQQTIQGVIDKQKKTLFSEKIEEEARHPVAMVWEYFVLAMVAYFVYSILNSLVQNYLNEQDEEKASG